MSQRLPYLFPAFPLSHIFSLIAVYLSPLQSPLAFQPPLLPLLRCPFPPSPPTPPLLRLTFPYLISPSLPLPPLPPISSLTFPFFIIPSLPFTSLSYPLQVRPHGTSRYCSDLLSDGGCVALLVVGFLLVTPLLVLALAAYCRLARHLQLGLCFIPYSRAVYKNLPATQHRGLAPGCCCCSGGGPRGGSASGKGKVWV